jgi:hypothetical protein
LATINAHGDAGRRPVLDDDRRGPHTTFESTRPRARTRADTTDGHLRRRRRQRLATERGIGPVIPCPHRKVEDDRGRDDRHHVARGVHRQSAARLLQTGHHSVGSRQTVCAPARQHDGVRGLHRVDRVEQVCLARTGAAAAHVDRARRGARSDPHHGGTGGPASTLDTVVRRGDHRVVVDPICVTDLDADDIGDAVAGRRQSLARV